VQANKITADVKNVCETALGLYSLLVDVSA